MDTRSDTIARTYGLIGIVALVGMWSQVARFLLGADPSPQAFVHALFANPAVAMLSIEMACMALASAVFMYVEAQRRQQSGIWLILLAALTLGFGVVFPLFLARRERAEME